MDDAKATLGIIGGSGTYDLEEVRNSEWVTVHTPWGQPSSELLIGELEGTKTAFLPRHGKNHSIPPSEIKLPRKYRCAEALRCPRHRVCQRMRLLSGGDGPRGLRDH